MAKTLFEMIWDEHVVVQEPDRPAVFHIDLHLIHEGTSPQAFKGLRDRGLKVRRPERTVASVDHIHPAPALEEAGFTGLRVTPWAGVFVEYAAARGRT